MWVMIVDIRIISAAFASGIYLANTVGFANILLICTGAFITELVKTIIRHSVRYIFIFATEVFSILMTSPALLGKGLALGLVSTFFPFVSYTLGLRQMEAGKASVLAFSEPMVAAVAGIVVFGEMLRVENVLGILLIFTALVVLNSRNVKR